MENFKWYNLILVISMITCSIFCFSCSNDSGMEEGSKSVYRVVLIASGEDYSAEANIANLSNVSLYDETKGEDLGRNSILEDFTGTVRYSTMDKVEYFTAQGLITSKKPATLLMTVFKDGATIYSKSVSIIPSGDGMRNITKDLVFTNIK